MSTNGIKNLIIKYLTNEISEEELISLNNWLNEKEENKVNFNKIRTIWLMSGKKSIQENTDRYKAWDRFWNKNKHKLDSPFFILKYKKIIAIAASWLIFMVVGSLIPVDTHIFKNTPAKLSNAVTEVQAPLGAKCIIFLPDNSEVWLNAGSKITYDKSFNIKERLIRLEGEAYFIVAPNKECPFKVKTSDLVVTALGTRFNIKAYPEEETITATLEEGKINITPVNGNNNSESIILKPNENIIYYKAENRIKLDVNENDRKPGLNNSHSLSPSNKIKVESDVNTEIFTSWKDERWIFIGEPLPSLALKLERRFNIHIVFAEDYLKNYKFSGSIENETIEQILQALRLTAPLKYKIEKNTIILSVDHQLVKKYNKIIKPKE